MDRRNSCKLPRSSCTLLHGLIGWQRHLLDEASRQWHCTTTTAAASNSMEGGGRGRRADEGAGCHRGPASRYAVDELPAARSRHAKESSPAACCLAFSHARATVRGMRPVAPAWQSPTRMCWGRPSKQVRTGTCVCCALRPEVDVGAASKGLTKSCNASHTIESGTN